MNNYTLILCLALSLSCANSSKESESNLPKAKDHDYSYWYQGKAELNRYKLSQSRYGEIREGHAVLIFVTEDMNLDKQVKADYPNRVESTKVLKLNFTKKFLTGIYPYSLMTSTFTPLDSDSYSNSLKVSTSTQEWCGHTFMQLNREKDSYNWSQYSYFESEADASGKIQCDILEDEIWNFIRLYPERLPTGKISIYPSTQFLRLKHAENRVYEAEASISKSDGQNSYTLDYGERVLEITYDSSFPHTILEWTEGYKNPKGGFIEAYTTSAKLEKQILSPYWSQNSNADSTYRKNFMGE